MPKRLPLVPHLTTGELARRYRRARDPVERGHYHILWLLSQGQVTREGAAASGYRVGWLQTLVRRYTQQGPAGLGDRRHATPGAAAILNHEPQATLGAALQPPPPGGGLWTRQQVAEWLAQPTGRRGRAHRGWAYLRRLGSTPHGPRPTHARADPAAQEQFRKTSASGWDT